MKSKIISREIEVAGEEIKNFLKLQDNEEIDNMNFLDDGGVTFKIILKEEEEE